MKFLDGKIIQFNLFIFQLVSERAKRALIYRNDDFNVNREQRRRDKLGRMFGLGLIGPALAATQDYYDDYYDYLYDYPVRNRNRNGRNGRRRNGRGGRDRTLSAKAIELEDQDDIIEEEEQAEVQEVQEQEQVDLFSVYRQNSPYANNRVRPLVQEAAEEEETDEVEEQDQEDSDE